MTVRDDPNDFIKKIFDYDVADITLTCVVKNGMEVYNADVYCLIRRAKPVRSDNKLFW
jgi:hypothetical protein